MSLFGSNPVFDMLKKDHQKVKDLFEQFEDAEDGRTKQRIMQEAIQELEVHARLEESLIYPAIRKEIDDEDVMDDVELRRLDGGRGVRGESGHACAIGDNGDGVGADGRNEHDVRGRPRPSISADLRPAAHQPHPAGRDRDQDALQGPGLQDHDSTQRAARRSAKLR